MTPDHPIGGVPDFLDFRSRPVPDPVTRQVHRIALGGRLYCAAMPWEDALALVEDGCVDLRVASGRRLHLCRGAIFSLRGLTPAVLTATEPGPAVLSTLSRRTEGAVP
jgi:hypothetical protein